MSETSSSYEAAQIKISNAMDAALSTEEYIQARNENNLELHLREMGDRIRNTTLEFLYTEYTEKRLTVNDVIKLIHKSGTPGWSLFDEPNQDELSGGEVRTYNVQFGDKVAPESRDATYLSEIFSQKLSVLLDETPEEDTDTLAAWAYTVSTAIHQFPDGNGRTGRGLVEFIRFYEAKKNNKQFEPLKFYSSQDQKGQETVNLLDKAMLELNLYKRLTHDLGTFTMLELYQYYLTQGRASEYFSSVKNRIETQINSFNSVTELKLQSPTLEVISHHLRELKSTKDYQTQSVVAQSSVEAFRAKLYK